jgi:hypothetical protein
MVGIQEIVVMFVVGFDVPEVRRSSADVSFYRFVRRWYCEFFSAGCGSVRSAVLE